MNSVNWFTKILRPFLGWIDSLIYGLISWILEGIFNLADLTVSVSFVQIIYKRIYLILAIFMVFKLTFSFIKYLISPDMMTDKEKGVGKIVSRSVVMLAILVFLPIVFFEPVITANGENKTILTAVQEGVLNTLPKIILGINNDEQQSNIKSSAKKSGENMAVSMLSSLYYDEDGDGIGSIKDFYDYGGNEGANTLMDEGENDQYKYTYMWPLTTIAGVLLVVILLGIAIDVAIRTFKLMILQVIAPIPVMSYIDPKSSKDGAFNSWIKSFTSTYLDLFIKLGTVYLLLLLIGALFPANGDGIFGNQITQIKNGSFMAGCFVKVFLIIGLFKFAKDAPKFIKEAMGIKDNGGGGLFGGLATLGAAAGTIGGAAAGLVGGAAGGIAAARAAGNNGFMGALKGVGGGLSGLARGGMQGAKGAAKGNPLKGVGGAISAQNAVTQRKMTAAQYGSTWSGRMGARASEFFTGQTAADRDKENIENYKEAIDSAKGFKSVLADSAAKSNAVLSVGGRAVNLKQFKGTLAAANAGNAAAITSLSSTYGFADLSSANAGADQFEKDWQKAYYTEVDSGTITDGDAQAVISAKSVADASLDGLGLKDSSGHSINSINAGNAGLVIGLATSESNKIKSSSKYKSNRGNAEAIKRNGK